MNSRERVFTALSFKEPDLIPFDFSATNNSGIALGAYGKLAEYLNLSQRVCEPWDIIQQLAKPSEEMLERLGSDFRGFLPSYYANIPLPYRSESWDSTHIVKDGVWEYTDEWGIVHRFNPDNDYYYSRIGGPIEESSVDKADIDKLNLPAGDEAWRLAGVTATMAEYKASGCVTVLRSVCAGVVEMASRLRGMDNFMVDLMISPAEAEYLMHRIFEIKRRYWEIVIETVGSDLDIIVEADDYGTQESLILPPEIFRTMIKPYWKELFAHIKLKAPHVKILFHSCGAVRELIPDFIEMGADALNPVHIAAKGMEPFGLKRDFGREIVFWGGGVDTQSVLPYGSLSDIEDDVKRNIDALAPGGGWIFTTVHNIQRDISPEKIMTVHRTFIQNRVYGS